MTLAYPGSNRLGTADKGDLFGTWAAFDTARTGALEQALDGVLELTVSGTVTLTTANNTVTGDQARNRVLVLSGTGGTVILPVDLEKVYHVYNGCTGDVTFYQAGHVSSGCVVPRGASVTVCAYVNGASARVVVTSSAYNGWQNLGTSSAGVGVNSFEVALPSGFKTYRAVLSLAHAAGADRDLTVTASSVLLASAAWQTMVTATTYRGTIEINVDGLGTHFILSWGTSEYGQTTTISRSTVPLLLDDLTFSLSGGATFTTASVGLLGLP